MIAFKAFLKPFQTPKEVWKQKFRLIFSHFSGLGQKGLTLLNAIRITECVAKTLSLHYPWNWNKRVWLYVYSFFFSLAKLEVCLSCKAIKEGWNNIIKMFKFPTKDRVTVFFHSIYTTTYKKWNKRVIKIIVIINSA